MTDPKAIAAAYLATWNETDRVRRRSLLAQAWTEGAVYGDPLMHAGGHDGIDAVIAGVQDRFPGCRFRLAGTPDGYRDVVRFAWELGPTGDEGMIAGTDVVTLEGGRIAQVVGFLDRVPAANGG